ncbi:hypothetical protein QL285_061179 [Trifolium repens]|nr:hypothetical protein QL285_061179 [Trifolium repens]
MTPKPLIPYSISAISLLPATLSTISLGSMLHISKLTSFTLLKVCSRAVTTVCILQQSSHFCSSRTQYLHSLCYTVRKLRSIAHGSVSAETLLEDSPTNPAKYILSFWWYAYLP